MCTTVSQRTQSRRVRKKIFKFSAPNPSKVLSFLTPKTPGLQKTRIPTTKSMTPNMNLGNSNTNNVKTNMNNMTPSMPIGFLLNYLKPISQETALLFKTILNRNNISINRSLLRNRTATNRTISISPRNITKQRGSFPKKINTTLFMFRMLSKVNFLLLT